jgi:type IV pilus assembly protein PilE
MPPHEHERKSEKGMNMKRGFTLIEMLVVLAILSILAAVAIPSYTSHITRTKRTEGQIALIDAMQQQERYHLQHNTYVAFSADSGDAAPAGFPWWSGVSAAVSYYELEAHACPGRDIADCVEVRAIPGTAKVNRSFRDQDCGALTLNSLGVHGSERAGRCWP